MQPVNTSYDTFINEFCQNFSIHTHKNTKHETTILIGVWHDKPVALKSCPREREAILYSKIKPHQNIVTLLSIIYQAIPENDKPRAHILMEGNDGITLSDTVIYKYNLLESLHIMIDITKGLQHLHSCGIIHHDIKMSNILVINIFKDLDSSSESSSDYFDDDKDNICINQIFKICDFGLSEFVDSNGYGSDKHRSCGTKLYMSREKSKNSTIPISTKVDIFAMGVLGSDLINSDLSSKAIDKYNSIMITCQSDDPNNRYTSDQLLEQLLQLQAKTQ